MEALTFLSLACINYQTCPDWPWLQTSDLKYETPSILQTHSFQTLFFQTTASWHLFVFTLPPQGNLTSSAKTAKGNLTPALSSIILLYMSNQLIDILTKHVHLSGIWSLGRRWFTLSFRKLFFSCYALQLISSFILFWIHNNMTSLIIYYLEFFTGKHIHRNRNTNLMVTPDPSSSNCFPLCPAQLLSIVLFFQSLLINKSKWKRALKGYFCSWLILIEHGPLS